TWCWGVRPNQYFPSLSVPEILSKGQESLLLLLLYVNKCTKARREEGILSQNIKLEKEWGMATLTLNRPERLNLINQGMINELGEVVEELEKDKDIRVIIITGAGDRAFTAGIDVNEMKDLEVTSAKEFISQLHYAIKGVRDLDKVTIAAINGFCFGGGCELAMACDLRIASENAQIGLPEIKVGIPSVIEAALMPLLIGMGRARELILLGEPIKANEAKRIGLINKVVPLDKLKGTVKEITDKILSYSPTAMKMQKRILNQWLPSEIQTAIDYSIDAFSQCFATDEPKEAMTAFLEKL
ncbi:enoyl-CoA hydratase/isomerase family protein, partial [Chloroflexota bacterium]